MAANFSSFDIPPLPEYTVEPLPDLVPWISDNHLSLALPIVAYWITSLFFHIIDIYNLFPQYRLHTPAELLRKNHATRWDVFRDVLLQQVIQTIFGLSLTFFDPEPTFGMDDYNVAVWGQRIRLMQRYIPALFGALGIDSTNLGTRLGGARSIVAGVLAGGKYPQLNQVINFHHETVVAPAFATWELFLAKAIYWVLVPAVQFILATTILDAWQYFLHRGMHMNQWLYTKFHSRHHRLYVPYAYGALYNHPVEGFALDTLGTGVAYLLTGMTVRQSMWFFTLSTIKTVDDHCGYALPWDPLQHITSNNAAYHDIHHQSWGIKANFSQPFFTFWDRVLDTMWKGGDVKLRYAKARKAADGWWEEQKMKADGMEQSDAKANGQANGKTNGTAGKANGALTGGSTVEEGKLPQLRQRQSPRKKTASSAAAQAGSLKGLTERVSGSLPNGVPRVDSTR